MTWIIEFDSVVIMYTPYQTESICVCAKEWELSAVIRETLNIHTEVRVLEMPTQSMTRLRPTTNSHLRFLCPKSSTIRRFMSSLVETGLDVCSRPIIFLDSHGQFATERKL